MSMSSRNPVRRERGFKPALLARAGALVLTLAPLALPAASEDSVPVIEFNIEAQSLEEALKSYGAAADRQVMFSSEIVAGRQAVAISGEMTADEALRQILAGSGLVFETTASGVVLVKAPARDSSVTRPVKMAAAEMRDTASDSERERRLEKIITTGSNIRGIAPVGAPLLSYDREAIRATGVLTTDEFVRQLPQNFNGASSFGFVPGDVASNGDSYSQAVDLRGLGADATLTLLNGRRLAASGSEAAFVDVSNIPLSALERVEVLTDGASSIYGADAIAGVVNFVLRDDYEGAESTLSYGAATEGRFTQLRAAQALGVNWQGGNALLSYEFFDQDELFASEKAFSEAAADPTTLLPRQQRHSLLMAVSQSLSDRVEFDVTGFFGHRDTFAIESRNLGAQFQKEDISSEQFLVSPQLTIDLTDDYSIRIAGDYSGTEEFNDGREYLANGTLNPLNSVAYRTSVEQASADLLFEGTPFALPGGDVGVAFGTAYREEQIHTRFERRSGQTSESRGELSSWSLFGETVVPLVGARNSFPGVQELGISLSARYDEFSSFGNSTNPKVGISWKPVDGLTLRGSYGTSFQPPALKLRPGLVDQILVYPFFADPAGGNATGYLVIGTRDDLGPETSETYTVGADYEVSAGRFDGSASISYYDINFTDKIGNVVYPPGIDLLTVLFAEPGSLPEGHLLLDPDPDFVASLVARAVDYREFADPVDASFLLDARTANLQSSKTSGVDFDLSLEYEVEAGRLYGGVAGNYILGFEDQASASSPPLKVYNRQLRPTDLRLNAMVGWKSGPVNILLRANHTSGYTNDLPDPDESVASWNTIDINASYDFTGTGVQGLLAGTRVSIVARNVLDEDPPEINLLPVFDTYPAGPQVYDTANANPFGRILTLNITKAW